MNTTPIRIAQVIGRAINGGVENLIFNHYLNIDRSKVQFDFLVENYSLIIDKEKIENMGGKVILIPSYKHLHKYKKELERIFKENKYDIVQADMNSLSCFSLGAAKKAGVKNRICYSLSTANPKEGLRYLMKSCLKHFSKKNATVLMGCSDFAGEWLFGKDAIKRDKYYSMPVSVDTKKYTFNENYKKELIEKHNLQGKFVIGTIGRLEKQKNQEFLIDVFSKIKEKQKNAFLIIIGDGYLKESLIEKIKSVKLENDTLILTSNEVGVRNDVLKYYSLFDVFVLPSLYEGLPTVGIEAQANGLPCVFSDDITKEIKILEKTKFLSLKDGVTIWADTIINQKQHRQYKVDAIEKFDVKSVTDKLTKLYVALGEK